MSYPKIKINFSSLMRRSKQLKQDGSNFIEWYQHLRSILVRDGGLYTIQEPLGDGPGDSADEQDDDDYRDRSDVYDSVQVGMLNSMSSDCSFNSSTLKHMRCSRR